MGNSPPTGGLRPANGDHRSYADISQNFKIVFTGKEVETTAEKWRMVYNGDKAECVYILSKTKDSILLTPPRTPPPHPKMLEINIHDKLNGSTNYNSIFINIYREQAGLLHVTTRPIIYHNKVFNFYNTTSNAYGGITDSIYMIYGSERRRGLLIMEWKRKDKDEFPYTGNVMHYYVNGEDGEDVGFYVAIKRIRQSRDGNDFEFGMDGPEQHPAHALAYMIDEVLRTGGTWKPTYCPHCANKYIDERRSDISESESDRDNVLAAPPMLHGRTRNNNAGTIVSNPGRFKGKDIGNTYIKHFNFGRKKW